MSRPGRVGRQLDARRRRETLAGTAVAGLGVVVAVVAIVAVAHPNGLASHPAAHSTVISSSPPSAASKSSSPSVSRSASRSTPASSANGPRPTTFLPLVVVNNTGEHGLAARAADTFRAGGWTVTLLDNLSTPTTPTCAYYDPDVANAQTVAQGLQRQFPTIKAVRPRIDELPDGPIVVVLTSDYPG